MAKVEIWDRGELMAVGHLHGFTGTLEGTNAIVMRDDGWLMSVDVRCCKVLTETLQDTTEIERDAARYRWLLENYAFGDGYRDIDDALNHGEADKHLSPAIDDAMSPPNKGESK